MRFVCTSTAAVALGAGLASAVPMRRQDTSSSACANITSQFAEAAAANETRSLLVDGELAFDCLNSMPFDAELGSAFVSELTKYLQFQSTIPVLKDPPESYLSQPVDLLGGLDAIFQKANTSQYQSQFEMDTDINNLLFSANDGHLNANGLCSTGIFDFSQRFQLVSVSDDGISLPKLWLTTEVALAANGSQEVSDVLQINGQNATEYLEKLGMTQQNQDPDAQWNDCFPSQAKLVAGSIGAAQGAFSYNNGFWPGTPEISLTFSNGSTATTRVQAGINFRNFNFTDGESLYNYACLPSATNTTTGNSTSTSSPGQSTSSLQPTATAPPAGYGTPVISDPYNLIAGYYVDDEEFNDTAVMFIPNFETSSATLPDWVEANFADIASQFVNGAAADGKTKMIIDVSGNPGGNIVSGFDLFKLFFPDMDVYSATRMRDQEAEMLMIKSFGGTNGDDQPDLYYNNPFSYGPQVTPDQNGTFSSWEELYGPDNIQGANMTSLYANFNFTVQSDSETPIRGYGGIPLNVTGQLFAPENILVVSDGYCQSTCTTFLNLMTSLEFGGVRSVAFGGRPIDAPMQAIGGVRGAQSMQWSLLSQFSSAAFTFAYNQTQNNSSSAPLSEEELSLANDVLPIPIEQFPLVFGGGNLNLRNSYDPDNTDIPLQFRYQPANCKLFYTVENLEFPATTWVSAARANWGNSSCVAGSRVVNATTT